MTEIPKNLEEILITNTYGPHLSYLLKLIPELESLDETLRKRTLIALRTAITSNIAVKMALLFHNLDPNLTLKILLRLNYHPEFICHIMYLINNYNILINPQNVENLELAHELLTMQYALVLASNPDEIIKRILMLNKIRNELLTKNLSK